MAEGRGDKARASSSKRSRPTWWAGYAACAWAFVFAAVSFYWAAGGTAGTATIGPAIAQPVLARDPTWVAIMWGTVALKVLAGLLALALVRPWGRLVPRWLLLTAAWGAGALLALYEGAASWVQHGLMAAGVLSTPEGLGATALWWHLLLWDPWWLLGGLLFGAAAWSYQCRSRRRPWRASGDRSERPVVDRHGGDRTTRGCGSRYGGAGGCGGGYVCR